jgi:hypothetical protein
MIALVESLDIMSDRNYQTAQQRDHEQHRYQESLQFPVLLRGSSFADFDPMTGWEQTQKVNHSLGIIARKR